MPYVKARRLERCDVDMPQPDLAVVTFKNTRGKRYALQLRRDDVAELLADFLKIAGRLSETGAMTRDAVPVRTIAIPVTEFSVGPGRKETEVRVQIGIHGARLTYLVPAKLVASACSTLIHELYPPQIARHTAASG